MRSSVTATRRAWSAARGRYHSRSQWVCGIRWKISPVIAPKAKGMPGVPRAAILRPMLKRSLLALPAIAGAALLATRLVPGSLPDGSTLLPSGWRIRPAGRAIPVGTLPLNLVTLSDGSVIVTNDGYGENSLMRIDPVRAHVVWRVPLPAAWLGLARHGVGQRRPDEPGVSLRVAGWRVVDQRQRGARRFRREALPGRPRAAAAAGPGGGGRQPERVGLLHRCRHARAPRGGGGGAPAGAPRARRDGLPPHGPG